MIPLKTPILVSVEKAVNGYAVRQEGGQTLVYKTLTEVTYALREILEPGVRLMSLAEVARESDDRAHPDVF